MIVDTTSGYTLSESVETGSNPAWLSKIKPYFAVGNSSNLLGENIGHLILYAGKKTKFEHVTKMLRTHFPNSFILVKQERSKQKVDVETGADGALAEVVKGLHFHCFLTYTPKDLSKNPHLSFESKVREMLKGKVKPKPENMKPIDRVKPWKYTGFRKISDKNRYNYGDEHLKNWDVFFSTIEDRRQAESNREVGKRFLVHITPENLNRVLNWVAYAAKIKTAEGRKNCIIYDNRCSS